MIIRSRTIIGAGVAGALLAVAVSARTPDTGGSCTSLSALSLPNTTITLAEPNAAGPFAPPGGGAPTRTLPAFCRVAATLTPSTDSDIKIEVWMPASGWNGKFQAVGNGAFSGAIAYPAMATALARGYATSSTDTGHTGSSAELRARPPGEGDRLRLARGARDDRGGEEDRRRLLRARARSSRTGTAAPPADGRR